MTCEILLLYVCCSKRGTVKIRSTGTKRTKSIHSAEYSNVANFELISEKDWSLMSELRSWTGHTLLKWGNFWILKNPPCHVYIITHSDAWLDRRNWIYFGGSPRPRGKNIIINVLLRNSIRIEIANDLCRSDNNCFPMHFKNARRNRIRIIRRKIHALHSGTQKDCNRYFHYYIRSFPVS